MPLDTAPRDEIDAAVRPHLDDAQHAHYARHGWCAAPGFLSAAQAAEVSRWTDELTARPEVPGAHMVYWETSLKDPAAKVRQRIEELLPRRACVRRPGARPPARRLRRAARRPGGAVQGQDQLQGARRRRLRAAPGPAGGLDRVRAHVRHRAGHHRPLHARERVPGDGRRPAPGRPDRRGVDAADARADGRLPPDPRAGRARRRAVSSTATPPTAPRRTSPTASGASCT